MGITVQLVGAWPEVVEAFRRHPRVLDVVISCQGRLDAVRERAAEDRNGHLERFLADPALDDLDRVIWGAIDLEKTWAGIHFLLTGEPEPGRTPATTPLQQALGGSEPELAGTSFQVAPRVVGDDAVRAVVNVLIRVDGDELRRRFDPDALVRADVYPEGLWHRDDALEYLVERYAALVWFNRRAAALGRAVLVCTNL
jgi:hypothetical protein